MNKALLCVLSLIAPHRPQSVIGEYRTSYVVYRDAHKEYCFRETIRLGRTIFEDEVVFRVEVDFKFCL